MSACIACDIGELVAKFGGAGLAEAYLLGVVDGIVAPDAARAIAGGKALCPQHAADAKMMADEQRAVLE
jgi:hypothetical protein